MNFGEIKRIHFVGLGGIGMSGIAEILTNYDFQLSGCDMKTSPILDRLRRSGVDVHVGHDASHVDGAELVVVSSAIRQDHPEVLRARDLGIEVIRRAEMLGKVMGQKRSVAIAGTHGKTTTSAMTGIVLRGAGFDPTLIVGGVIRNLETNASLGSSDTMVVEADEYDRSFLALDPTIAVITNVEADHLDCYADLDDILGAFRQFASKVPADGAVIVCVDDEGARNVATSLGGRIIRYGTSEAADVRATNLTHEESGTSFDVERDGATLGRVKLNVPGEHNVRNALAAISAGLFLGADFAKIVEALSGFRGVERRFQLLGTRNGAIVVDDYAHHPSEIRATLDAARKSHPDRRIVALFQPHLFTRTRDFYEDFAEALSAADVAWVTPIYPAREEPIEGVTSALILDAAARRGAKHVEAVDSQDLARFVGERLQERDLFLTMGAGDVHRVGEALVETTK